MRFRIPDECSNVMIAKECVREYLRTGESVEICLVSHQGVDVWCESHGNSAMAVAEREICSR